jgi:hypothetical protein
LKLIHPWIVEIGPNDDWYSIDTWMRSNTDGSFDAEQDIIHTLKDKDILIFNPPRFTGVFKLNVNMFTKLNDLTSEKDSNNDETETNPK